jgi:hypothetical protein
MSLHACMYVCMCVCMCVCVCDVCVTCYAWKVSKAGGNVTACVYVCTHTYFVSYIHMYVCTHTHTHTHDMLQLEFGREGTNTYGVIWRQNTHACTI